MEAAKEKISNISASAKAGMDKTKATAEEKAEKMKTKDPLQKETAEERKEEKIRQAELEKQQAREQNAIRKGEAHHTGVGLQTGLGGHSTGVGQHQTGLGEPTSGHQTGLGGHHTAVGHQTGLGEPTSGVPGLHRTDAPVAGTKTNLSEH